MIRTRLYRAGELEQSDFSPALVSDFLDDPECVVWLDLAAPDEQELHVLSEEFRLHPLAMEDAIHPHQRPKLERYKHHTFLVMYSARFVEGRVVPFEVDAFFGEQFLITVRKDPSWSMEPVLRRWDNGGPLLKHGVVFLLHGLVDAVVDGYFPIIERLEEELERIEDEVFDVDGGGGSPVDPFNIRKNLITFRRMVLPMRSVVASLLAADVVPVHEDVRPYFADVHDHVIRVADSVEALQDLLSASLNLHLSLSSNRLNDIMRKVTGWAAIVGVATTIAGVYGMNFRLFPRGDTSWGFWFATALILGAASGLYLYFRRKDWL